MGLEEKIVQCIFCQKDKKCEDIARSYVIEGKTTYICKKCKKDVDNFLSTFPEEEFDHHDVLTEYDKLKGELNE